MNLVYAYCLVEDRLSGFDGLKGVENAEPFCVECPPVFAVVSPAASVSSSVTPDRVRAHQRVLDRILERTTPLPFRFGTLVEEHDLRRFAAAQSERIAELFARGRGSVQMTIKMRLSPAKPPANTDDVSDAGPGRRFLEAKRAEAAGGRLLEEQAAEIRGWLEAELREFLLDTEAEAATGESLLRVAHRIRQDSVDAYLGRLREVLATRPQLRCLISGPWPPYTLVDHNSAPHAPPGVFG